MTETDQHSIQPDKDSGAFSFKLENSKIFRAIVETLSSIIDEATFTLTPEGFTVKAMDPSRICLLELQMKADDFDEYECTAETKVSLNLDDLEKIMKRTGSYDMLTITHEYQANKIKILMKRIEQTRSRTFSLGIIDIDTEEIPMENLLQIEYPSSWKIDPEYLIEALKDAEIYSEILNIKAEEEKGLIFSSSGQIGEMVYSLEPDDLIESHFISKQVGAYSITFLKAILRIASITETLEVSLKSDYPIKMIFQLLEGGKLSHFTAPRVEESEFDEDDTFIEGEDFEDEGAVFGEEEIEGEDEDENELEKDEPSEEDKD